MVVGWAGSSFVASAADEPLGERIGPFIFWPLIVLLLAVLVWVFTKRTRDERRARASATDWTRPEAYAEHHQVAWAADPATFTPTDLHWPLAVAAVFGICGDDPWDELAYRTLDDPREGLREAWGIRSRPELLTELHWLLREGHRVRFTEEFATWAALGETIRADLAAASRRPDAEATREQTWRLQQFHANARGIRDVHFEAWDLVRAAMLTRAGHSLGWLSEAEAIDTLHLLAAELQRTYPSWEEMGDHFFRARWHWGSNSSPESRQTDAHDASRQSTLLEPPRGPWTHVAWDRPLPASRLLLVDALIAEELLVQPPANSPTLLAVVIDAVTSERLDSP